MAFWCCRRKQLLLALVLRLVNGFCHHSGSSESPVHETSHVHHHCDRGHHHHHHHHDEKKSVGFKLPEELAEKEDLHLHELGSNHGPDHEHHHHDHHHGHPGVSELSGLVQGKPSKAVVDSLAFFGGGAMLGDAFLHQLPHAFGGEHSHSHEPVDLSHHAHVEHEQSHSHSLKDLSVGISILAGIVLFLLVEKVVRYVDGSGGTNAWSHSHHHHHKNSKKSKDDSDSHDDMKSQSSNKTNGSRLQKRKTSNPRDDKPDGDAVNGATSNVKSLKKTEPAQSQSNLVFGYLNLFSDGVHNFTDGMALGSAFLLHGSVGGWSRTLSLHAHELPQEIGDFGILVRSGFSVSKALFFNFLSALVALAGTVLALLMGRDPGHSSLIEGFRAGRFIYIAVAGVLAEMNNDGSITLRNTALQLTSLILGMAVALGISLVE